MNKIIFLGSALVLLVLGCVSVYRQITLPVKTFRQSLEALNGITVGETTESDLLGRPFFQKLEPQCLGGDCFYHQETNNAFLSTLRLAPRTGFTSFVAVKNGVVHSVFVSVWRAGQIQLMLRQTADMKDCRTSPCLRNLIPPNKVVASREILYDSKSEIRNHLPEAVNGACLSHLRGCRDDYEVMPIMRQLAPAQAISTTPAK